MGGIFFWYELERLFFLSYFLFIFYYLPSTQTELVGAVVANVLLGDNANDKDNVRELRNEIEFLKDTDPLLFSTSSCLISKSLL